MTKQTVTNKSVHNVQYICNSSWLIVVTKCSIRYICNHFVCGYNNNVISLTIQCPCEAYRILLTFLHTCGINGKVW